MKKISLISFHRRSNEGVYLVFDNDCFSSLMSCFNCLIAQINSEKWQRLS
jgi:hypothetical protein